MAIEKRQAHPHGHQEPESRADFEAVLDHVRDNPLLYVAATVFTIVAVVAGVLYYSASEAARKETATQYMAALLIEEPSERVAALAQAASTLGGDLAAEALYMAAETAYNDGDAETARRYFERVRAEHGGSHFAAPATEGLGHLFEEEGEYAQAMDLYREVQNNHAYAFEARRQHYNLGRIAERQDDIDAAIDHYSEQINAFPGSSVAQQAQMALERLRREHPDSFPDDFTLDAPAEPGIMLDGPAVGMEEVPDLDLIEVEPPAETEAEAVPVEIDAPAPEPVAIEDEAEADEDAAADEDEAEADDEQPVEQEE